MLYFGDVYDRFENRLFVIYENQKLFQMKQHTLSSISKSQKIHSYDIRIVSQRDGPISKYLDFSYP